MTDVSRSRPLYARLAADNDNDNNSEDGIPLTPRGQDAATRTASHAALAAMSHRGRHKKKNSEAANAAAGVHRSRLRQCLPTARRFWADFTLGFADGLTVPFALTAGLSSLGQTDTVVYAGLAEVSAGCISMGIGGYLSARQSKASSAASPGNGGTEHGHDRDDTDSHDVADVEAFRARVHNGDREKHTASTAATTAKDRDSSMAAAHRYIEPLGLPAELQQMVMEHMAARPLAARGLCFSDRGVHDGGEDEYCYYDKKTGEAGVSGDDNDEDSVWPIAAGLSVALGYLIGGLLPLWPYFFVTQVGDGLRWSFAVCIVALFFFGFARNFALDNAGAAATGDGPAVAGTTGVVATLSWRHSRIPWRRLWKSSLEGLQMVILGGIAAIAAVLCVRMFEGASS